MRLGLLNFVTRLFMVNACYKQLQGYNCKHGNHSGIRECDGKRI